MRTESRMVSSFLGSVYIAPGRFLTSGTQKAATEGLMHFCKSHEFGDRRRSGGVCAMAVRSNTLVSSIWLKKGYGSSRILAPTAL